MTPVRPPAGESPLREVTPADVARLQQLSGYPMVSVLLPAAPGAQLSPADRAVLAALLDRAHWRLALELRGREVDALVDPLRELADQVSSLPNGPGLALFAGGSIVEAYRLAVSPVSRVVVDPTFATRDLARAGAENPPYRLLTLAAGSARLHLGVGAHLREGTTGGFPIDATDRGSSADRRGHHHQAEPTHRNPRRWDRFLREVDTALDADPRTRGLPLVLAAAEPLASRYRGRTNQRVVGFIAGNHQRTSVDRLAALARPVIDLHLERLRQDALGRLDAAVSQRRAAYGVNDVWTAARDRRVAVLLVDPGYTYPALAAPDGRSLTPASDPEHPDVLDDAVDEIIELVARRDGEVYFTTFDDDREPIAAVLRTR